MGGIEWELHGMADALGGVFTGATIERLLGYVSGERDGLCCGARYRIGQALAKAGKTMMQDAKADALGEMLESGEPHMLASGVEFERRLGYRVEVPKPDAVRVVYPPREYPGMYEAREVPPHVVATIHRGESPMS